MIRQDKHIGGTAEKRVSDKPYLWVGVTAALSKSI